MQIPATRPDRKIILQLIENELKRANDKFPPFHSTWEGAAILREEHEELWEEIRTQKNGDTISSNMIGEAVQVAAMAIKFLESLPWNNKECCNSESCQSEIGDDGFWG